MLRKVVSICSERDHDDGTSGLGNDANEGSDRLGELYARTVDDML
jgi:hypothetical protein